MTNGRGLAEAKLFLRDEEEKLKQRKLLNQPLSALSPDSRPQESGKIARQKLLAFEKTNDAKKVTPWIGTQKQKQREQQKQKQVQQQQQQSTQQLVKQREDQLANRRGIPYFSKSDIQGHEEVTLINRHNIKENLQALLGIDPDSRDALTSEKYTRAVFDNVVGPYNEEIFELDSNLAVTHLSLPAMKAVLRHSHDFFSGISLNNFGSNLPQGFYIRKDEKNKQLRLLYREKPPMDHSERLPLRMKLRPLPTAESYQSADFLIEGSYQEADLFFTEKMEEKEKVEITTAYNALKINKNLDSINAFLKLFNKLSLTKEMLIQLGLNDNALIKKLVDGLLEKGPSIFLAFYQQLVQLHTQNKLNDFKAFFMDGDEPLSSLFTADAIIAMDELCHLEKGSARYYWWQEVVKLQKRSLAFVDFLSLWQAFSFFCNEIKELCYPEKTDMSSVLPLSCPLTKEEKGNAYVVLDQILLLLHRALDKKEQLNHLDGINLRAHSAPLAVLHYGYTFVTPGMNFTLQEEPPCHPFVIPYDLSLYPHLKAKLFNNQSDESKIEFFRRMGKAQWALSYSFYEKWYKQFEEMRFYHKMEKDEVEVSEAFWSYMSTEEYGRQEEIIKNMRDVRQTLKYHQDFRGLEFPEDEDIKQFIRSFAKDNFELRGKYKNKISDIKFPKKNEKPLFKPLNNENSLFKKMFASQGSNKETLGDDTLEKLEKICKRYFEMNIKIIDKVEIEKIFEMIHFHAQLVPSPREGNFRYLLLHFVGLCTTTRRQFEIEEQGVIETFLEMIKQDCSTTSQDEIEVRYQQYEKLIDQLFPFIELMDEAIRPSLADIAQLLKCWQQDSFFSIYEWLKRTEKFPALYQVLRINKQREQRQDKLFPPIDLIIFLSISASVGDHKLYPALAVLADVNQLQKQDIQMINQSLASLSQEEQTLFLNVIANIAITKSKRLPSMHDFFSAIENYGAKKQTNEKIAIDVFLQQQWVGVYVIEPKPIANSLATTACILTEVLQASNVKEVLDQLQQQADKGEDEEKSTADSFSGKLKNFGNSVKNKLVNTVKDGLAKYFSSATEALNELMKTTTDKELDELIEIKITQLEKLEVAINSILQNPFISTWLSSQKSFTLPVQHYINTKKLIYLLQDPVEQIMKENLSHFMDQLQLSDHLKYILIKKLGAVNMNAASLREALMAYGKQADQIVYFINVLIKIRNVSLGKNQSLMDSEFDRLIALWEKNEKELSCLTFEDHIELIKISGSFYSEHERVSVDKKLEIIYEVMAAEKKPINATAWKQLKSLMAYEGKWPVARFLSILKLSFTYNMQHEKHAFPFDEMSIIQSLDEPLFHLLLKKLDSNINSPEIVIPALQETAAIVRSFTDEMSNKAGIKFLSVLLTSEQSFSWESYKECLEVFINCKAEIRGRILKILTYSLSVKNERINFHEVSQLIKILNDKNKEELACFDPLYQYQPFPQVKQLINLLNPTKKLNDELTRFDLNPYERPRFLHENKEASVTRVINGIIRRPENRPLNLAEKNKLWAQWETLSVLSYDRVTRDELYKKFLLFKKSIHLAENQVNFIALMSEVMYRTKGIYPNSTQMLVLLLNINEAADKKLLFKIRTGEGKSILLPMIMLLEQLIESKSAAMTTANTDLTIRDQGEFAPFFDFFKVPTRLITEKSELNGYLKDNIDYHTLLGSSLYHSDYQHRFPKPNREKRPKRYVLDEADEPLLNDVTLANLADAPNEHPYPWIYGLVTQFIDQSAYQETRGAAWTEQQDLVELKIYLQRHANQFHQKEWLKSFSDEQLREWLDTATQVLLHYNNHYYPYAVVERDGVVKAIPIDKSTGDILEGSTFEKEYHQFLYARLKLQQVAPSVIQKGKFRNLCETDYLIDPVGSKIATESAEVYLCKQQRWIGLSATPGDQQQLNYQASFYGATCYDIPPHLPSQLVEKEVQVGADSEERFKLFYKLVPSRQIQKSLKNNNVQPFLAIDKDIASVKAFYKRLAAQKGSDSNFSNAGSLLNISIQCITGEETLEERNQLIANINKPNYITVVTPLCARGLDSRVSKDVHPEGLCVVSLSPEFSESDVEQIKGRTARQDDPGTFWQIFSQADVPDIDLMTEKTRALNLAKLRQRKGEDTAIQRYYVREINSILNVVLKHQLRWIKLILNKEHTAIEQNILFSRITYLINTAEKRWLLLLEQANADVADKLVNPYIQRDGNGLMKYHHLDKALAQFEKEMLQLWKKEEEFFQQNEKVMSLKDQEKQSYQAVAKHQLNIALFQRKNRHAHFVFTPISEVEKTASGEHWKARQSQKAADKQWKMIQSSQKIIDELKTNLSKQENGNFLKRVTKRITDHLTVSSTTEVKTLAERLLFALEQLNQLEDDEDKLIFLYRALYSTQLQIQAMQSDNESGTENEFDTGLRRAMEASFSQLKDDLLGANPDQLKALAKAEQEIRFLMQEKGQFFFEIAAIKNKIWRDNKQPAIKDISIGVIDRGFGQIYFQVIIEMPHNAELEEHLKQFKMEQVDHFYLFVLNSEEELLVFETEILRLKEREIDFKKQLMSIQNQVEKTPLLNPHCQNLIHEMKFLWQQGIEQDKLINLATLVNKMIEIGVDEGELVTAQQYWEKKANIKTQQSGYLLLNFMSSSRNGLHINSYLEEIKMVCQQRAIKIL